MNLLLCALLLLFYTLSHSAQTKIFRCQQPDGTIVIQDIHCKATSLKRAASQKSGNLQRTNPPKKPVTRASKRVQRSLESPSTAKQTNRSPYFTFGWSDFIPVNWSSQQRSNHYFEETFWSKDILNSPADFKTGVILRAYRNTMKSGRVDAFAQALNIYHGIRDDNDNTLIDSQFKRHDRFKVFNIKYEQPLGLITTTEFYIDESYNDLFVVTVQSEEKQFLAQWQLANQIIEKL